uniref:Apple domain-containing protein n=1 Tax=Fusarium oxysporum (strain Fo5176) TaxID=660025 RepID=A0A0D2Y0K5_FUSOF
MKASVIYGLAALFGASHFIADCVEGHRETITPDYIVEHKCNMYRTGTTHERIVSAKDCAALCQAAGVERPKKLALRARLRSSLSWQSARLPPRHKARDLHTRAVLSATSWERTIWATSRRLKTDLAACKAGCAAVGDGTTCRSYAHDGGSPGTCLLYYKHIRELQPAGNFKVEGAWRSWDKEC